MALNHSLNGILDRSTERNFTSSPGFRSNHPKDRAKKKKKKNFDPRKLCVFPKFEQREGENNGEMGQSLITLTLIRATKD